MTNDDAGGPERAGASAGDVNNLSLPSINGKKKKLTTNQALNGQTRATKANGMNWHAIGKSNCMTMKPIVLISPNWL